MDNVIEMPKTAKKKRSAKAKPTMYDLIHQLPLRYMGVVERVIGETTQSPRSDDLALILSHMENWNRSEEEQPDEFINAEYYDKALAVINRELYSYVDDEYIEPEEMYPSLYRYLKKRLRLQTRDEERAMYFSEPDVIELPDLLFSGRAEAL